MKTDRIAKKVLQRSYDFAECREDIDLIRSVHEGTLEDGKKGDPNFHGYAATLNITGVFALQALDILELIPFNNKLADFQDEYMPSYPPMSPITKSYFQAWMLFDARVSPNGPTMGRLFAHYLKKKNTMRYLWKALDGLNDSYGSFYEVEAVAEEDQVQLWDIVDQKKTTCWNSSGYGGELGEIWYVRQLPSYLDDFRRSVTVNTPYVFKKEGRRLWEDFFSRQQNLEHNPVREIGSFLKHGKSPEYWLEFVFQAYANHTGNAIFLEGFPDIAESRPHADSGRDL